MDNLTLNFNRQLLSPLSQERMWRGSPPILGDSHYHHGAGKKDLTLQSCFDQCSTPVQHVSPQSIKGRIHPSLHLFPLEPSPSKPGGSKPKNHGLLDVRPLTSGLTTNHTPVRNTNSSRQCLCRFSFIQLIVIHGWI